MNRFRRMSYVLSFLLFVVACGSPESSGSFTSEPPENPVPEQRSEEAVLGSWAIGGLYGRKCYWSIDGAPTAFDMITFSDDSTLALDGTSQATWKKLDDYRLELRFESRTFAVYFQVEYDRLKLTAGTEICKFKRATS